MCLPALLHWSAIDHGNSTRPRPLVSRFHEARDTMKRRAVEFVHSDKYAAEVQVELIEDEGDWTPRLSLDGAKKLESVRLALKRGDVAEAAKLGKVFELLPVSA